MLDSCLQVAAAEAQLAERQRNLATMVTEADGFLAQERRSRKAARRSAFRASAWWHLILILREHSIPSPCSTVCKANTSSDTESDCVRRWDALLAWWDALLASKHCWMSDCANAQL